jgi:hypothetical protein
MKGCQSLGEDGGWNRIGVAYVVEKKKMGVVHSCNPGTGKADEIHGVEASTYRGKAAQDLQTRG